MPARGAKRKRGEKGAAAARGKTTAAEQQRITAAAKKALEKRIAAYRRLRDSDKSCCTRACLSTIPDEQAVQFITMVRGLEKDMQQMMMRALICTVGNTGTHFNVHLNGFGDLCRDAFAVVMGVHKDTITALRKNVATPLAIEPPEHGLVGRRGNRSVGTNSANHIVAMSVAAVARDFALTVYSPGMLPVGRIKLDVQSGGVVNQRIGNGMGFDHTDDSGDVGPLDLENFEPICLPLGWSLTTLYRIYTAMCDIEGCQAMAVSSFHASLKDIWPNKVTLQPEPAMYECVTCKARGEELRLLTMENRMKPAKMLMNSIASGKYPLPPLELLAVPKATPLPSDGRSGKGKEPVDEAAAGSNGAEDAKTAPGDAKTAASVKASAALDSGSSMPLRFDAGEYFGEPAPSLASITPSVSAANVSHRAVAEIDELARTMANEQALRCVNTRLAFHLAEADRLRSLQAAELSAARQSVGPMAAVPHLEYAFNVPFWLPQLRPRVEVAWARHVRSFSVLDANADEWDDTFFWDYVAAAGPQSTVSLLDAYISRNFAARVDVRHMRFRSPSSDDHRLVLLYHAFRVLNNEVDAVQHTFKLDGHDPSLAGIRASKRMRQFMSRIVLTMDDFVEWWQTDPKAAQRPTSTKVVDEEAFRQWHPALERFFALPPVAPDALSFVVRRDAEHGVAIETYNYTASLPADALMTPAATPLPVGVSRTYPLKTQWHDPEARSLDAAWTAMANRTVQSLPMRGLTRPSWLAMHRLIEEKVSDEHVRSKLLPPSSVLVTANEAHRRDALHAPERLTAAGTQRVEMAIAAAKAAASMPKTIPTSTHVPIQHHHSIPPQSQMAPVSATNMGGAYVGENGTGDGTTAIPFSYMVQDQPTNRDVSVPDTFAPTRTDPSSSTVELPLNVTVHQSTPDGK